MLSAADLEANVLQFRQRSFQFERLANVDGLEVALFRRTETESESQFRPRLVHLWLAIPLAWVVRDEAADLLRVSRDGRPLPMSPDEPVVEIRAEPPEFAEQGLDWRRTEGPSGALVYAPRELGARLLSPKGIAGLGIA